MKSNFVSRSELHSVSESLLGGCNFTVDLSQLKRSSLTFLPLVMSSYLFSYTIASTHETTLLAEWECDPGENFTHTQKEVDR